MSDLMAKCDWYDGTLSVVLPEDPERIAVRMFDSRLAPARLYVPEVETLTLRAENAKLRELVSGLWYCAHEAYGMCARVPVGGERPFTCCPLYDFDSKVYRCEKLILELRVEVDG